MICNGKVLGKNYDKFSVPFRWKPFGRIPAVMTCVQSYVISKIITLRSTLMFKMNIYMIGIGVQTDHVTVEINQFLSAKLLH